MVVVSVVVVVVLPHSRSDVWVASCATNWLSVHTVIEAHVLSLVEVAGIAS